MIEALVRPEQGHPHGMFRFADLPRPGDRISIGNSAGGADMLDVLYVLHNPVLADDGLFAQQDPVATVMVRFRESFGGKLEP